jgi:hypothetical protein
MIKDWMAHHNKSPLDDDDEILTFSLQLKWGTKLREKKKPLKLLSPPPFSSYFPSQPRLSNKIASHNRFLPKGYH